MLRYILITYQLFAQRYIIPTFFLFEGEGFVLFKDVDGDHTISVDEFTERCVQLHGPARSADIYALRQNTAS